MKILLDHCVDRRLASLLAGHAVHTAADMGWGALSNGQLLRAALEQGFGALLTTDRNLRYQQNLASLPIPVVVLHAADARLQSLKPLLGQFNAAVAMLHDCRLVVIHADGAIERVSP